MNRILVIFYFVLNQGLLFGQSDPLDIQLLATLQKGTEIAVGIYEQGEIKKYGFGVEKHHLEKKDNADKLFEIGSITKVFTTLSTLKVLDNHQIGLHSSVSEYLPSQVQSASKKITFYRLLTHTSGLPKMPGNFFWSALRCPSDPFLHYCENRMLRYLKDFTLQDSEEFQYSNLGMGLSGYLSSRIDGQPLDSVMHNEIFRPLKMNATSLGVSTEQFHLLVNSIGSGGAPKHTWEFSDVTKGAGNIYSNVHDMTVFLKSLFDQGSLTEDASALLLQMEQEQIKIDEAESMGFEWRIYKNANDSKILYHGGITYGFKSLIAYNRELEKGIVILTNAKGLSRKENTILKKVCFEYLAKK